MIKKGLLILIALPMIGFGQQTYVPDDNFEQTLINQGYDTVLDDYVLTANINQLTILQVGSSNIADLTGIEGFTALDFLYCGGNQLTSLDVSSNYNLKELLCADNQLQSLFLPNSVEILDCYSNQLSSLNTDSLPNLVNLDCSFNYISTLDLSNNIALGRLECISNQMTNLTLNDTALTFLSCSFNSLTSLDLSQNNNLTIAYVFMNQLNSLNINGADSLVTLIAFKNELTFLDVSSNTILRTLGLSNNQLTSLDVSNNYRLSRFACTNNYFTSIDVSYNPSLWRLFCDSNQLTDINIGSKLLLEEFNCSENNLAQLDFSNVDKTNITSFHTRNNPNLFCIEVEDESWSTALWTDIDSWSSFSEDCYPTNVEEVLKERKALKVIDVLGKQTKPQTNIPFIKIYDDGTVEKRIIIE
jgi:Leucine-rich repeat (LRR) protein